jgi:hypothetical protein
VTPEELATLKAFLAPWTPAQNSPGNASGSGGVKTNGAQSVVSDGSAAPVSLATVQPEPNGFPFDPTFESWKPLNTNDRGDNNTFRFVLGNDARLAFATQRR